MPNTAFTTPQMAFFSRRRALLTSLVVPVASAWAQRPAPTWRVQVVDQPEPVLQLRAAETDGWLMVGAGGGLRWLRPPAAPLRLAQGIDPGTPVAAAHGRVVARRANGGLWVAQQGGLAAPSDVVLSAAAGCTVLPLGVIAVEAGGKTHLVRAEPDARGAWRVTARSHEPVLPDAQPLQVALENGGGGSGGDGGHIAVLAGADAGRYKHGVLGDAIEATRVLYLERHDLTPLRKLSLPAPHVFEDNRLRAWNTETGLLLVTVRSGPQGAQLAAIEADRSRAGALRVAALGEPIGTAHRWMAPSTHGRHLLCVHTPHLSGALHGYRREGARLVSSPIAQGLSNHAIGSHELDASAWLGSRFVLADLARRRLRCIDAQTQQELTPLELPSPLRALAADAQGRSIAVALGDGSLWLLSPAA